MIPRSFWRAVAIVAAALAATMPLLWGCSALRNGIADGMERAASRLQQPPPPDGYSEAWWIAPALFAIGFIIREIDKRWFRREVNTSGAKRR